MSGINLLPLVKKITVFVGMVVVIGLCGAVLSLIAALVAVFIVGGGLTGFSRMIYALAGILLGYPVGVILGIILVNRFIHYNGSIKFGIICTITGWVIVIALFRPLNIITDANLLFSLILIVTPVFGTIGFHLVNLYNNIRK